MRKIIFVITLFIHLPLFAVNKAKQVEDLFIWKISDELKLSVKEEKSFAEIIRKLNKEKSDLSNEIETLTNDLKLTKDQKKIALQLKKYKQVILKYNQISSNEIEKVEKLLGQEKAAKYIVLKSDFTSKLKQLFSTPADPGNTIDKSNPVLNQNK